MLKNLEMGLAEREAMIRILQSNKTMSNSNLAAEIVNKAASGVIVGIPATSGVPGAMSTENTLSLGNMTPVMNQASGGLHMTSLNPPRHHYQLSLADAPSSSTTAILHNKTLSHLTAETRSLLQASSPSFSSASLILPVPPAAPAPLSSNASTVSLLSSAMHHSKQLSTPITMASGNTFKSISLNSTPIRSVGGFGITHPSQPHLQELQNSSYPHGKRLLLGRSMTPSADLMLLRSSTTPVGHTASDILRSMTPNPADLLRPTANTSVAGVANQLDHLGLNTAALRRESAPAGVFAGHTSTTHPLLSSGSNSGTK